MNQKVIIAIVAIIIILGTVIWYTSGQKAVAPEVNNDELTQNTNTELPPGDVPGDSPENNPTVPTSDTIVVSTQVPGDYVTVDNLYLSKPGFVDIHEVTANGQLGKSVGVTGLLAVGAKQDLEIKAAIKPGAKYFAVIHFDDGDKKYDYPDDAAGMKDGLPLQVMFSVSQ